MAIRFAILLLILAANGFFAAAEVALVSVRQSRLRELAEAGNAGAQSALSLLANPGRLLSVTQVGVTLASLGLGWAGEDTLYRLFRGALDPLHMHASAGACCMRVAFALAFLMISYCHVIIGEVVPKNLAIEKADRIAILVAPALLLFYRLSQPFVFVIERTSALILRVLGLLDGHSRGGHSAGRTEVHHSVDPARRPSAAVRRRCHSATDRAVRVHRARDHDAAPQHRFAAGGCGFRGSA